jgi:hypothetical protein
MLAKNTTRPPLRYSNPDLIPQWDFERNSGVTPDVVTNGSNRKVWWICPAALDHRWEASPKRRVHGEFCPFCTNKRVAASNCLETLHPDLAAEWDADRNGLTAREVTAKAKKYYWWRCPAADDHRWQAPIARRAKGHGCPFCSGNKVVPSTSIAARRPELAAQWDHERNGYLKPDAVSIGSKTFIHWKCPLADDHRWTATLKARRKSGCPCCAGIKLVRSNCLATTHPEVAAEWDLERNGEKTPYSVMGGHNGRVHWICKEGHRWTTSPNARTRAGHRCPGCQTWYTEESVGRAIESLGYLTVRQYSFPGCRHKATLRFDFAVFHERRLIAVVEYHGEQHYRPVDFFGGEAAFRGCRKRDGIKRDYCRSNGIPLLEIPFNDADRIPEIVAAFIGGIGHIRPSRPPATSRADRTPNATPLFPRWDTHTPNTSDPMP